MNNLLNGHICSGSALWIENLVDGMAGMTIRAKNVLLCESSPFQKIEVIETYSFGRVLLLGGAIMFTERDGHVYNEMITHPAMFTHAHPKKVCIIGGGDGGVLTEVLRHQSVESVVAVEIDQQVTSTVRRFFPELSGKFQDPRLELIFDDGYEWLTKCNKQFDIILVDSDDPGGPVASLETDNFLDIVKSSLNPDGIAVIQTESPELQREKIRKTQGQIASRFEWQRPFIATIPSFPLSVCSFIMCGSSADTPVATHDERVAEIASECKYFNGAVMQGAFNLPNIYAEAFN
jgi:spermidine synthase